MVEIETMSSRGAVLGLALSLATTIVGCFSDQGGGPTTFVTVDVWPTDATTGPPTEISVVFFFPGSADELTTTYRMQLVTDVRLTTARTGERVTTAASFTTETAQTVRMRLTPNVPLADGWHVLDVRLVELDAARLLVDAPMVAHDATSSSYRTHFHVGSMPLLLATSAPTEIPGTLLVGLHESEPITIPSGVPFTSLIRVSSGGAQCACAPDASTDHGYVWLRCTGVDVAAELAVSVAQGVTSLSGIPLHDMDGMTSPATVRWVPSTSADAPNVPSEAFLAMGL